MMVRYKSCKSSVAYQRTTGSGKDFCRAKGHLPVRDWQGNTEIEKARKGTAGRNGDVSSIIEALRDISGQSEHDDHVKSFELASRLSAASRNSSKSETESYVDSVFRLHRVTKSAF